MPVGYGKLLSNPRFHWKYRTEPELALQGRALDVPCGRVLGGTGSINGMLYVRGHRDDYDGWRDAGNPEWDYASVLPWFKRSEANARGADAFHGRDGPLAVADAPHRHPLADAFVAAAVEAGIRAQRRLQRRAAGRLRLLPVQYAARAAREHRHRVPGAVAQARKPPRRHRRARRPDRLRRPARGRRRLSPARRRIHGVRATRRAARRGDFQLPADPAALGRRRRTGAGRALDSGRRRPAGRGREPARPLSGERRRPVPRAGHAERRHAATPLACRDGRSRGGCAARARSPWRPMRAASSARRRTPRGPMRR